MKQELSLKDYEKMYERLNIKRQEIAQRMIGGTAHQDDDQKYIKLMNDLKVLSEKIRIMEVK